MVRMRPSWLVAVPTTGSFFALFVLQFNFGLALASYFEVVPIGLRWASWLGCLCLLAACLAIACWDFSFKRCSVAVSCGLFLVAVVSSISFLFEPVPRAIETPWWVLSSIRESLAFGAIALAIFFLNFRRPPRAYGFYISGLALLACSVGLSSFFQLLLGISLMPAEMEQAPSLLSAAGVSWIGALLTEIGWREWSKKKRSLKELRFSLILYSTGAALFIALVSAWFALSLLWDKIENDSISRLENAVSAKAKSIEWVLWHNTSLARQVFYSGKIMRYLEIHGSSGSSVPAVRSDLSKLFDELAGHDDEVLGLSILNGEGEVIIASGEAISKDNWPSDIINRETPATKGPLISESGSRLVVGVPIIDYISGRRMGTGLLLFRENSIGKVLSDKSSLGETGEIYLGIRHKGETIVFSQQLLGLNFDEIEYSIPLRAAIENALEQKSGILIPSETDNDFLFTAYLPVPNSDIAVAGTVSAEELYSEINEQFFLIGVLVVTLVFLAGYGTFLLMRNIMSLANALQVELEDKTLALEQELERRKKVEAELEGHKTQLEDTVIARTEELRASQDKLIRSERLASMGIFAAGIAHEINNPIGVILACAQNAQELKEEADGTAIVEKALNKIVTNAKRCGLIVKSILQFSRQEETEKWENDLNEIIARAVHITKQYLKQEKVRIQTVLDQNIPKFDLSPVEIEQVIVNLVKNAAESSDVMVSVTVATKLLEDGRAEITVADDGAGMANGDSGRAFDPFFTTRQKEGGNGLGLSVVHGVVQSHKGEISIDSQEGKGTQVRIILAANSYPS